MRQSPKRAMLEKSSSPAARALAVRPARRADVDAVSALDAGITGLPKLAHWLDLYRRQGMSAGASARTIFLVATHADEPDRVVGFIVGEIRAWEFGSPPCGWVYALSVDASARQRGVGERLLSAVAEEFRNAGMDKMRTMVARHDLLPMLFFRGEGMMAGPYVQLEKDLT
jgi:ribosomal protein S18 acetylase RimI-like enzyme